MKLLIIFIIGLSISFGFAMKLPERPKRPLEEELQDMPDPSEIIEILKKRKKEVEAQASKAIAPTPMEVIVPSLGSFEQLPKEVREIIIKYLVTATGRTQTQKLYNAADAIRNFLTTNTYFKQYLDDYQFIGWIVKNLANRYTGNNLVKAALALGTKRAAQWLASKASQNLLDIYHCLMDAAYEGNEVNIKFLLSVYPQDRLISNTLGADRINLLMAAASGGSLFLVNKILESGLIDINARSLFDDTAINLASSKGHAAVVERLLKAHADVDSVDANYYTPLMHASLNGHEEVVTLLLAAKAEVNVVNVSHNTPLMFAVENGNVAIVDQLVKAGANVNIPTQNRWTALMKASQKGYTEVVERLLAAGANVNKQAQGRLTALIIAAGNGHTAIVEKLLAARADASIQTQDGWTALRMVQQSDSQNKEAIIKLLRDAGAQ